MSATTVGFSVTDEYRARLERLVEKHTPGNRSEFLRRAIDVMEHHDRASDLAALQEYGEVLSRRYGVTIADVATLQSRSLDEHDPAVQEKAAAIVAKLKPIELAPRDDAQMHPVARIVIEQIAAELGISDAKA